MSVAGERRRNDRRRLDRRQAGPPPLGESWFGVVGVAADRDEAGAESMFEPTWLGAGPQAEHADSRFIGRQARRIVGNRDGALARVYRTYAAARAVIGAGLVAAQVALALLGASNSMPLVLICLAYAVQAITRWLLPRYEAEAELPQRASLRRRQWLATIGVDLLAFGALHTLASGVSLNFAALMVLPVLMAGVMTKRLLALGTAAAVTLLLLVVAWQGAALSGDATGPMLQSGLAGLGFFVIALLAGELSGRLAREELAARGSLELARQQALLNRLVIEEMADGVLVVDHRQRVRAANPAARALLVAQGLSVPAPFVLSDEPAWNQLADAVGQALIAAQWPDEGSDLTLHFENGFSRTLRVRVRFMQGGVLADGSESGHQLAVLWLEDVRTAQSRIRQEKLAAMGRVSAGIAHEIRNPLAAIAQANALLLEDGLPPAQQRLARMVADNVERLKRLVEDVMEVAPGAAPSLHVVDATAVVADAAADWADTAGLSLGTDSRLRVELPMRPLGVVFDAEHLRRVLVNLLDNARRHASEHSGAIVLRLLARDEGLAQLAVLSDSECIAPEVERYLFEPFFSTRSRGSGLGLYICRELCERYSASIEYRARPTAERMCNEFVVTMKRGALLAGNASLPLEP